MIDSLRPLCADILSGLAWKHANDDGSAARFSRLVRGADTLLWADEFDGDAAARVRGYASIVDLEAERDEQADLVDELTKQIEDTRLHVVGVEKILNGLSKLTERVYLENPHEDCGDCAITALIVAVDEARRAIKAAVR